MSLFMAILLTETITLSNSFGWIEYAAIITALVSVISLAFVSIARYVRIGKDKQEIIQIKNDVKKQGSDIEEIKKKDLTELPVKMAIELERESRLSNLESTIKQHDAKLTTIEEKLDGIARLLNTINGKLS